jgi:hypothetical protein
MSKSTKFLTVALAAAALSLGLLAVGGDAFAIAGDGSGMRRDGGSLRGIHRQAQIAASRRQCRRRCMDQLDRCIGDLSRPVASCFRQADACVDRCGGPGPIAPPAQAR